MKLTTTRVCRDMPHITTMRTLPTKVSAVARKTITLTKPAVSFSLFCPLNIPATPKKEWVRKIVDAAKKDDSVDFIISVNHRPIQAEQYVGDISAWVRNEIIPILSETPKHVLNYGGHHHLYHRGS